MRPLLLFPLFVIVAACAATPERDTTVSHPANESAVQALYRDIAHHAERFRSTAPSTIEDGVPVGDRPTVLAELRAAADACAALPGCSIARVLDVYAELLQLPPAQEAVAEEALLHEAGEDSPLVEHMPAVGHSVNLLNGRELGDVIAINGPIKAALNEWLTWMRPQLIEAYENYQYLRHQMWPAYEQAGLPEALLFGILAKESGAKVHAVSRAGAAGPLQFMPATGQRFGLGRGADGFDSRFDPAAAARANVRYLNERFADFNHDLALALAAYNGGEGRVARLVRRTGRSDFWDPRILSQLPTETRDYVPMVLAAAWLFLHPDEYGLEFPQVKMLPAQLALERDSSLNMLAICLGNAGSRNGWFRALRNLNPRYMPQQKLPAGTVLEVPTAVLASYRERCVDGDTAELAATIAQAAIRHPTQVAGTSSSGSSYTVRSGDTLASIARRHQCRSPEALARSNRVAAPKYLIRPGQKLRMDGCRR